MRRKRRIRSGCMDIETENMHRLIDVTACVNTIRDLQGKDWKVYQIPATLVAWRNGGTLVILEAGFRCRIHGSLDAALAAEQAYRAVVLESTRDLRGLATRLGSDWGKTVPDMAVAVRRFETFLAGWRAHTGDVWPNDEWESLLAECHRLIAMRRAEIEELRARAALNLTLTSLAIALVALVVAVIPLGVPGYIAVALAGILTAVMVFIAHRVGHIVSGDRPITLS